MGKRPALRALARRLGIAPDYLAQTGERRRVSDATRVALLGAMGFEAGSESRARDVLVQLADAERARVLEPVLVARAGSAESARLRARAPAGGRCAWRLAAVDESGARREARGASAARDGWLVLRLPWRLAPGYHTLELELGGRLHRQQRIAAPARCTPARGRALGLWAHLALLRGERDRGRGDLGTLCELIRRAAGFGIDFIGLEPLHARLPPSHSPYSPLSRLFRDPLYLDQRARRASGRAHAAYRAREGETLAAFATYCALAEELGGFDHRSWPLQYRDVGSAEVARFRGARAERIDFHARRQCELDAQLGAAARAARARGMRVGLYTDLAVGSAPGGFDVWAFPGLFARAARIGCPPDFYSREGQDWGLPPLDPHRLRETGFAYFRALLRSAFAHAGALRIDHAMGLRRLFWIPEGRPAREGAYVAYPERELRAILALESRRAGALVIGEDLGTVPAGFSESLARDAILSTRIVYFERRGGSYRPARAYSRRALVSVNNHDLPPVSGWLEARDVELRLASGALSPRAARAARAQRAGEVRQLRRRLAAERLLPPDGSSGAGEFAVALARFAARTPAPLVALSLDDLAGEREPINLPGVGESRWPSWQRRARADLRDTFARPAAREALELARRERRSSTRRTR
jgi:4-alpha-glucanotransferase